MYVILTRLMMSDQVAVVPRLDHYKSFSLLFCLLIVLSFLEQKFRALMPLMRTLPHKTDRILG